ncbi:MAG: hypothetical protein IPK72_12720 [Candidatus Eisenbacteria bacterium]|nr:hypothetical protein [Candidatus Eisenbacteria bacterium]
MRWGGVFALGLILLQGNSLFAATSADQISIPLSWSERQLEFRTDASGKTQVLLDGALSLSLPGQADLPEVAVTIDLPAGKDVASWTFVPGVESGALTTVDVGFGYQDRPQSFGGPEIASPTDRAEWPREVVRYAGVGTQRGVRKATFIVSPVRWQTDTGALFLIEQARIDVRLTSAPLSESVVICERGLTASQEEVRDALHARAADAAAEPRTITATPSLESAPVEVLIITPAAFEAEFQALADWKNEIGRSATVRTTEWIYQNYPQGADGAEKIRLFLRDAYRYWGIETAILAGDPSVLPIRYAKSWAWNPPSGVDIATDYYFACLDGNWNANGNATYGEALRDPYNLVSDEIDLLPEIMVGRIPVRTVAEAVNYLDKYLKYVRDPEVDAYHQKVAVFGEVLFDAEWRLGDCDTCPGCQSGRACVTTDGAEDCFLMIDSLSASERGDFFEPTEYYERDYWWKERGRPSALPLTRNAAVNYLNGGVGMVFHMGHGDRDRWAIGPDRLEVTNFLALTNGDRVSGMAYTINCNSAAVDFECAAEGWLNAPNGGGVLYIGSTNLDFPVAARALQAAFFGLWPGDGTETPGKAYYQALQKFEPLTRDRDGNSIDGTVRFLSYSLIFLGDPEITIWSSLPAALTVQSPAGLQLGSTSASVSVSKNGSPLAGAVVSLYKAGDAAGEAITDAAGVATVPFTPGAVGSYKVTVTHPDAIPFRGSGQVTALSSAPFLSLREVEVRDAAGGSVVGNGNAKLEVGETIELDISYANRGGVAASGGTATLRLGDLVGLAVTIEDGEATLPNVPAGGQGSLNSAFRIRVNESLLAAAGPVVDLVDIPFEIDFTAGGRTHTEAVAVQAVRPDLIVLKGTPVDESDGDGIPERDENFRWELELFNRGAGDATHARARLEASVSNFVQFRRSSVALTPVATGGTAQTTAPFAFTILNTSNLYFTLFVEDTLTTPARLLLERRLDLTPPAAPDSVGVTGFVSSVRLEWDRPTSGNDLVDLWGYRIERADSPTGTFSSIGTGFVEGLYYYQDEGLPPLTRYAYRIAAVDSSGNTSGYSAIAEASTSPGPLNGWPFTAGEDPKQFGGPTVQNLNAWGGYEVFLPGDYLYALNADGGDYVDGDGSPSTRGIFYSLNFDNRYRVWGKPAVCDIINFVPNSPDNRPEVICIARNGHITGVPSPGNLMVFDASGNLLWNREITPSSTVVSSPAVGDIDGDGDSEIVFLTAGRVFAFHHNGDPVIAGSGGMLRDLNAGSAPNSNAFFLYGSVAIGDVTEDAKNEIVFTTRTNSDSSPAKLYILRGNGTDATGFPMSYAQFTTTAEQSNSSVALMNIDSEEQLEVFVTTLNRVWCVDPNLAIPAQRVKWSRVSATVAGGNTGLSVGNIESNPSPAVGTLTVTVHPRWSTAGRRPTVRA